MMINRMNESFLKTFKTLKLNEGAELVAGNTFKNSGMDCEIIDHKDDYTLIYAKNKTYQPYIVAYKVDETDGSWGQGHYFDDVDDAQAYFEKVTSKVVEDFDETTHKYEICYNDGALQRTDVPDKIITGTGTKKDLIDTLYSIGVDVPFVNDDDELLYDFDGWVDYYENEADISGSSVVNWIKEDGKTIFETEYDFYDDELGDFDEYVFDEGCQRKSHKSRKMNEEDKHLETKEGTIANLLNKNQDKLFNINNADQLKRACIEIVNNSDLKDSAGAKNFLRAVNGTRTTGALLSTIGTFMTGLKVENLEEDSYETLGADLGEYQKWVDYDMKRYGKISGVTNAKLRKAGLEVVKDDHGDYEVIAKEKDHIKEDLGKDIDKYQEWVDYDMKRYGRISRKTNQELRKAGLKVVKDKYGDYEVMV